jgi:hypothetical protein
MYALNNSKEQQRAIENSNPNISTPAKAVSTIPSSSSSSSSNPSALVASLHKRKQVGMYVDQSSSPMMAAFVGEKPAQKINIAAQQLQILQVSPIHTYIHAYKTVGLRV